MLSELTHESITFLPIFHYRVEFSAVVRAALLEAVGMLTRVNGEGFVMETSPRGAGQLLAAVTGVDAGPASELRQT